jgi:hypothetical protein
MIPASFKMKGKPMHDDKPTEQYLKVITFLDMTPGYADTPDTGEKIGILTIEHNGEIEQPMMIRLADVKRLVAKGAMVVAHHGDEETENYLSEHCPPQPSIHQKPRPSPLEPTGVTFKVRSDNPTGKPLRLYVLGGYQRLLAKGKGHVMLIVRSHDFGNTHEFVARLGVTGTGTIYLRGHPSIEVLPQSSWLAFARKEPCCVFTMQGLAWRKVPVKELRQRIGRKTYTVVRYDGG